MTVLPCPGSSAPISLTSSSRFQNDSAKSPSGAAMPHKAVVARGYKGEIFPIHPKADEIMGYKAYKSVKDVAADIDVAVFAIPAKFVAQALVECGLSPNTLEAYGRDILPEFSGVTA